MTRVRSFICAGLIGALLTLFVVPSAAARADAPPVGSADSSSEPLTAIPKLSDRARAQPGQALAAPVRYGPFTWINLASGSCLDQDYTGNTPHARVLAWPCSSARNQRWYFDDYGDGTMKLVNARSGHCLDQNYSNGVEHVDIFAWPCNTALNQRWVAWTFNVGTGVYYQFENYRSAKHLDQDYSDNVAHSRVIAYPFTNRTNQTWYVGGA